MQIGSSSAVAFRAPAESLFRYPVWLWPNLLSLDAPCVAVAWCALLAKSLRLAIDPLALLLLGATVWIIYVADRILDVRACVGQTARHRFVSAHRAALRVATVAVLLLTAAVGVHALSRAILIRGFIVAVSIGVYFIYVHGPHAAGQRLKQLAVAALFAAGVVLPLPNSSEVAFAWGATAAIVWLHISAIDAWESNLPSAGLTVASIAVGALCSLVKSNEYYSALAVSAFLMAMLNALRPRLSPDLLRAAVDLALVLPATILLL